MVRVLVAFCFVSLLGARPAFAQQVACAPGGQTSIVEQFKAALDASGGRMELRPEEDALVLTGLVELPVPCQKGTTISAERVEIFFKTGMLVASGNVVFATAEARIHADRVEFNMREGTGTFHFASGIMSLAPTGPALPAGVPPSLPEFGNQDPDVYFWGELIEKLSVDKYRLTDGGFTTCVQPEPRWAIGSDTVILNRNDYAMARNMVLRVKGVPLLYVPVVYYPIRDDGRATGFLLPTYGTSTLRGPSISNAFFWAISRSQDATFFHDWYTRIGQGIGGEYRYVSNGSANGNTRVYRLVQRETRFEQDGGTRILPAQTSYMVTSAINQGVGPLRAQARVEYFTDITTGQLYFRDPYIQTQSRRIVDGGITGIFGPATVSASYLRAETFTDARNSGIYGTVPGVTATVTPVRIAGTPLYAGVSGEFARITGLGLLDGVVQSDTGLTRMDLAPSLRAPLSRLTYLSALVTATYRTTHYSRSLDASGRMGPVPATRQYLSLQSQFVGPVFTKIWDTPGSAYSARMKHVIEPTFTIDYVTDVTIPTVLAPGTEGGAMRFNYGITNRLFARKPDVGATLGATREFLTIGVQQAYYTDRQYSTYDYAYTAYTVRPAPVDLSPIALTVRVTPVAGFESHARAEYDVTGNGLQILLAGVTLTRPGRNASVSFGRYQSTPVSPASHFVSGSTALSLAQKRVLTSYSVNWDIAKRFIQGQNMSLHYFAQCCGVQADFGYINYPPAAGFPIPTDRRFNIAVVLAGLGTFSNFFDAFVGQP